MHVMNGKGLAGLFVIALLAPSCLGGGGGGGSSGGGPAVLPKWQTLQRVPTTSDLRGVAFANLGVGVIVGKDGSIFRTGNGGETWVQSDFTPADRTGDMVAVGGLNLEVVAVGSDASGAKEWRSSNTWTWTTPNAPGSGVPYVDVSLSAGGFGPADKVDIHRLRSDGNIFYTLRDGTSGTIATTTWTNAKGFVPVFAIAAAYVCGDQGGVGKLYRGDENGPHATPTIPANTKTFRRIVISSIGQPFACGDNNTDNGIVIHMATPNVDPTVSDVWTAVPGNPGGLPSFNALAFPDIYTGYVVGNGGTIYKMKYDPGTLTWTWTNMNPGGALTTENLHAVFFKGENHGWIVGDKGTVLRTTNAASDIGPWWSKKTYGVPGINWNAASFSDDGVRGVVVGNAAAGNGAIIFRTLDGGASWSSMANPVGLTTQNLLGVSVPRNNGAGTTAYICGSGGVLIRNPDVWNLGVWDGSTITGTTGTDTYRAILFPQDGNRGVCVGNTSGGAARLLRTSNGTDWLAPTTLTGGAGASYNALSTNPAGTAVYASGGANSVISVSTDPLSGWDTWGLISPTTGLPGSLTFPGVASPEGLSFRAIVIGSDRNVYKYRLATGMWDVQTGTPWGAANLVSLGYSGDLNGVLVTDAGEIYTTINGGQNWLKAYPHTKAVPRAVWMSPTVLGMGYVLCNDGVILKTWTAGQ